MSTFTLRRKGGATEEVEFTPMRVNLPGGLVRLALHKTDAGGWALSEPSTGYRVLTVAGSLHGIRTTSRGYSLAEARREARKQFLALVETVGIERVRKAFADAAEAIAKADAKAERAALLAAAKATGKLVVVTVSDRPKGA